MLTWRSPDGRRIEQVRVAVTGNRIKAYGRIIVGPSGDSEAFNASYDLVTSDSGSTRRLSINLMRESGSAHISISRDQQGMWTIESPTGTTRSDFGGAVDVDVAYSPFFNALPIRRLGIKQGSGEKVEVPVAYVFPSSARVEPQTMVYTPASAGIAIVSPVTVSGLTIDENGFVVDYDGLASRLV